MTDPIAPLRQRLDKWLWAARFFKTRRLATDAVDGGKVRLNDLPVKPSREIACGDMLDIVVGELRWIVCEEWIIGLMLAAMTALTFLQVVMRYVFNRGCYPVLSTRTKRGGVNRVFSKA